MCKKTVLLFLYFAHTDTFVKRALFSICHKKAVKRVRKTVYYQFPEPDRASPCLSGRRKHQWKVADVTLGLSNEQTCESNGGNERQRDAPVGPHRPIWTFFSKKCVCDIQLSGNTRQISLTFEVDGLLILIIWIFHFILFNPVWPLIDTAVPLSSNKIRLKASFWLPGHWCMIDKQAVHS